MILILSNTAYAQVASEEERAPQQSVAIEGSEAIMASDLIEGTYEIEVKSSSSMFRIVHADLTVEGEEMYAAITLGGTGYLKLFMGTGEEAIAAPEEAYAEYTEDADGSYVYEIPVSALNVELECTGFSKRKEKWYDHQILFKADTLPEEALTDGGKEKLAAVSEASVNEGTKENTAETATAPAYTVTEIETTALDDGTYEIDVTLSGGSGRAGVATPSLVTVADGTGTAQIIWSSPNYDYMIVNGGKILPSTPEEGADTDGNSTFTIPVTRWDAPMDVIGDTTAMSTPHEVSYQLTFDSSTAKALQENKANRMPGRMVTVVAVLLIAAVYAVMRRNRRGTPLE